MADKRKVIMDVDTGTDDAIALAMAMLDPAFDLIGICSVNGNVEVKLATNNTLRVVELCEKQNEIKVYQGADYPICSTLLPYTPQSMRPIPRREGSNGKGSNVHPDYLPLPEPTISAARQSAVAYYLDTLLNAEDHSITLIPVGPLTNVALAIRSDPRIVEKIDEIIYMGGGHEINNSNAATEFNVFVDPEAMEIVLQSGVNLTIVPLDATHQAFIEKDEAPLFREIGTPVSDMVAALIEQRVFGYSENDATMQTRVPIHDALAVCAAVHPEVLRDVIETTGHCDISGGRAYGQTIFDTRNWLDGTKPNCRVALGADREFFRDWMLKVLRDDKARRA